MSTSRQIAGRVGGLRSWANTVDRTERTAPARRNSPASIEYHLARLDPDRFANATDAQRLAAAEAAHRLYYAEMAMRSVQSRRRNRQGGAA
jgi:hypothetical protein